MAEIIKAAENFAREHSNVERAVPRAFFRRMGDSIREVKAYMNASKARSDYRYCKFLQGAKAALKFFRDEGEIDVVAGDPYIFLLAEAYLSATDMSVKNGTFFDFMSEITRFHDFKISETFMLYAALVLALTKAFARAEKHEEKMRCIGVYVALETLNFDDAYVKFTKTHRIFSGEKAGVYENLSRESVAYYDEMLAEKYEDEIKGAEEIVSRANAEGVHIGKYLIKRKNDGGRAYFWLLSVLIILNFATVALISNLFIAALSLFASYALSKEAARIFFERRQSFLPRLDKGEALEKTRCTVAVTTLLCGERSDGEIFDNLEDFYLQNKQDNFTFAVLGDLKEAKRKNVSGDAEIIRYAVSRIEALNKKYGAHFSLFIRRRRFAVCERKYFGWERKRGAVLELCRYAKGNDGSFETIVGGESVRGSEFLLTLDSDTKLGICGVREMLGIMLHPQNVAAVDKKRGKVVSGYGIIQPKMAVSLLSSEMSAFAALTGGGGTDRYSAAAFDLYQDVFGRGVYCGKGMINIDVFLSVCDGFFPRERILSHDLLEGALAGAASAGGVVLTDSTPKTAKSYFSRLERWIRGDLQALSYAFKTVKNESGETVRNPMGWLSRYQISDNIVRAATPLFNILLLIFCSYYGYFTAIYPMIYVFVPFLKTLFFIIFGKDRQNLYSVKTALWRAVSGAIFEIFSMAEAAGTFIKATVNVIYSAVFSKRGFLSWTTAAELDAARRQGMISSVLFMWHSIFFGAVAFVFPAPTNILGVLWILFPFVAHLLGKKRKSASAPSRNAKEKMREYAADIWKFFEDNVNEHTNWLPPDNVQLSPVEAIASRTSPTNIGLYFLSMLAARDMGFIDTDELYRRSSAALSSVEKMLKWNGHLYNWYDTGTLSVIGIPFVSSVDSGNFVTSLVTFCEGIKEYISENVNLIYVEKTAVNYIYGADFGALINKDRGLLSVGYNVLTGALSESCYDAYMSEARTTAYFAEATHAVPCGYFYLLGRTLITKRGQIGAASWSGTAFEFFMPSLFLPEIKRSFSDMALKYAFRRQTESAVNVPEHGYSVFGVSESCYFEFDHDMNYQYRAFGLDSLSLDPETHDERVISPYSSFLMLSRAPYRVMQNLKRLVDAGMYGKYGFYEAIDLESSRVGGGYAIIKSYMSHHLGMSIVAIANASLDGVFVKRFMKNPHMRSCVELLGERAPVGTQTLRRRDKIKRRGRAVRQYAAKTEKRSAPPPSLISPSVAMLSNNKTRVIASSSGHMAAYDGEDLLFAAPFDKFSLGCGFSVSVLVDGVYISAFPLGYVSDGVFSEYSFYADGERVIYRSSHKKDGSKYELDMTVCLHDDDEIFEVKLDLFGNAKGAVASLYFEPVIDVESAYCAHKSFSNLFTESKFYSDEGVLIYRRRPKSDGRAAKYLGVSADPSLTGDLVQTRRDDVLPLLYGKNDIAKIKKTGKEIAGACVVPACAISVRFDGGRAGKVNFKIGCSKNRDDLIYLLSSKKDFTAGKIYSLQRAASGADDGVCALERRLLSKIMFPSSSPDPGMARSIAKMPVFQKNFWKYGISGDGIWLCAVLSSNADEQTQRLSEVLSLFKFSCIRGLRYDLIILYRENDKYGEPCRRRICGAVSDAGLYDFLGCGRGIFIIDEALLGEDERFVMKECAAARFELSQPNDFSLSDKYYISPSDTWQSKLKKEFSKEISDVYVPDEYLIGVRAGKGVLGRDGFTVIKNGDAPPWTHVISSEKFGTVLSENSIGYTFFGNSVLGKLTPHSADNMREDDGEKIIIRLYKSTDSSSFEDYDAAACSKYVRYSDGCAEYIGSAGEVRYEIRVDICGEFPAKRVEVALFGGNVRADVIYRVRPCLGNLPTSNCTAVFGDAERRAAFFAPLYVKEQTAVRGVLALREGRASVCTDEAALLSGGKIFCGNADICAVCDAAEFSGRHVSVFFLCAVPDDAHKREIFEKLIPSGGGAYTQRSPRVSPRVFTNAPETDALVNFWLPYQTLVSRMRARAGFYQVGGAYGFRDQLQDVISLIPYAPDIARAHIIRAASHQYEDGSVMHWWHEYDGGGAGIRSRISDDCVWLSFVLAEYVKKTGDTAILDVKTKYLSSAPLCSEENDRYENVIYSNKDDTVLAHAMAGLCRAFATGAHKLPLIGTGDWNDGMNGVGRHGRGESVWLAFFAAICAKKLADVCIFRDMGDKAEELLLQAKELVRAADKSFDGNWYIRGYYDDGSPLGSNARAECKVDIMPQAFAAVAASEVDGSLFTHAKAALENASKILFDRENSVFRLLWPPFDRDGQSPGYIKGYVPGIRENGGQYTHAAVFAALGMLRVGMNREAAELMFAINPMMRKSSNYKIEPYVLAGDVYSNPEHNGRGGWSWYTGAAGWYRTVFIEELCGFRLHPNGFSLEPKFSDIFSEYTLEIEQKGTVYTVRASMSEREFYVLDGKESENFFPFDGKTHTAELFCPEKKTARYGAEMLTF